MCTFSDYKENILMDIKFMSHNVQSVFNNSIDIVVF